MVIRRYSVFYLLLFAFLSGYAWSAQISVRADRTVVSEDESFTLVFESQQSVDDDPDFSPLEKDFRILSRNQSSSIQIINGRMSRQGQWTLTVLPKSVGTYKIPPIAFGKDRSDPITITVNPVSQQNNTLGDSPVYFELSADVDEAFVQSQIILTARIYHAVNLMNANLSDLALSDKTAVVEELEGDARFDKRIGTRRYKVIEKRYAVFPRTSGKLSIEPQNLEVQFVSSRRALTTKRLYSKPIHIKINPQVPFSAKQSTAWLPARSLVLSEEFPKLDKDYRVGDPITRTIRLSAEGLPPEMLPELDFGAHPSFKTYPERPVLDKQTDSNGVVGVRQETVALVPTSSGKFSIPVLHVPWFNTVTKKWETASLPARTLTIAAADDKKPSSGNVATFAEPENKDAPVAALRDQQNKKTVTSAIQHKIDAGLWPWATLVFFWLWVITILAWWLSKRRGRDSAKSDAQKALPFYDNDPLKALNMACRNNNAQAAKDALLQWGSRLGFATPVTSLSSLALSVSEPLASEVRKLNNHLYASHQYEWDGQPLLSAIKQYKPQPHAQERNGESSLEPLYYAFDKNG